MQQKTCPHCGSDNILPVEREYKTDYPLTIVIISVFFLIGAGFLLFFLLQLNSIILILILIGLTAKLLEKKSHSRKKIIDKEYLCLQCDRRFKISEVHPPTKHS
ncbi:hypothetical protein KGY73_02400 [bacterium]|nr:hypothetical protein [bacterium]